MKRNLQTILTAAGILLSAAFATRAQVAAGGNYTLEQSVIAGGGTRADAGNLFSITGAIGQAITDSSSASPFIVRSGFFTAAAPLAPTAATVSIGGRVLTDQGRGIKNVLLTLTDSKGNMKTATTTSFGYYSFAEVLAGETYIITARGKRFSFVQPTQVLNVNQDTTDVNFVANPVSGLRGF